MSGSALRISSLGHAGFAYLHRFTFTNAQFTLFKAPSSAGSSTNRLICLHSRVQSVHATAMPPASAVPPSAGKKGKRASSAPAKPLHAADTALGRGRLSELRTVDAAAMVVGNLAFNAVDRFDSAPPPLGSSSNKDQQPLPLGPPAKRRRSAKAELADTDSPGAGRPAADSVASEPAATQPVKKARCAVQVSTNPTADAVPMESAPTTIRRVRVRNNKPAVLVGTSEDVIRNLVSDALPGNAADFTTLAVPSKQAPRGRKAATIAVVADGAPSRPPTKGLRVKKAAAPPALKVDPAIRAGSTAADSLAAPSMDGVTEVVAERPRTKRVATPAAAVVPYANPSEPDETPSGCATCLDVTTEPAAVRKPRRGMAGLRDSIQQEMARGFIAPLLLLHDRYPHSRVFGGAAAEAAIAAAEAVTAAGGPMSTAVIKKIKVEGSEGMDLVTAAGPDAKAAGQTNAGEATIVKPTKRPQRAAGKLAAAKGAAAAAAAASDDDEDAADAKTTKGAGSKPNKRGTAVAAKGDDEEEAEAAVGEEWAPWVPPLRPTPRSVPTLGYACLNSMLREYEVFTSRDCTKGTFEAKGLSHVSKLALANARDLLPQLRWNDAHGIKFFRLSSGVFPWMSYYQFEQLPDFLAISKVLKEAGDFAKSVGQRLTFHPSEFTKIAAEKPEVVNASILELEAHSRIFDLMGFLPATPYNKINFHVGGVYGDKIATMDRFAEVLNTRLSPNCKARITIENDDRASMYSIRDLLYLHEKTGNPLVFDFHHWRFCTGDMTEEEAFRAAIATWPKGIRPVVHWSESQQGRKPHAHSDYVEGPISLYGLEDEVDVMIESKSKELALLQYREAAVRVLQAANVRAALSADKASVAVAGSINAAGLGPAEGGAGAAGAAAEVKVEGA